MNSIKKITLPILLLFSTFFIFSPVLAQTNEVHIDFFYSSTCPHCQAEKEFLSVMKDTYDNLDLSEYEIINNKDNQALLSEFYANYN